MMITEHTKQVIPMEPGAAKRMGEGCYYLDLIVWLNGDRIELGDRVSFNYGCYVNGYGGLLIGDDSTFGPHVLIHTANHELGDGTKGVAQLGWRDQGPIRIGPMAWVGMGSCILPGSTIGEGCVVGAGSVVTGELEPWTISVGNPARVVKERPR